MIKLNSLASRLLVWLIVIQVATIVIGMLLFPLLAPYTTYAEIAEFTARKLLLASLQKTGDGRVAFQPSPEFGAYKASRPELQFAIVDLGARTVVTASSEELQQAAVALTPYAPKDDGSLTSDRPGRPGDVIVAATSSGDTGRFLVVTAGNAFGVEDASGFFSVFAPAMLPIYGPVILGAFIAVPLFVRRTLAPLNVLVSQAEQIDVGRTQGRLPEAGLEEAFRPLIRSINAALDRLDQGFSRQKLYAANAAHELRTPLAILHARVDSLPESPLKLQLKHDTLRIETLLEQMLTMARLGQQALPVDERVDLVALARSIVADRAPLALRSSKAIAFSGGSGAIVVTGNRRLIESAISNLIDNALRAEPVGGTVQVSVSDDPAVCVADHGGGVAPEDREAIFEPFWRKDERPAGTGLGLAIVREVMDRHGGSATVLETCGGGATFEMNFRTPAVS